MANYEYIIASLPVLNKGGKGLTIEEEEAVLSEITEQLSNSDRNLVSFLQKGWDDASLNEEFYSSALRHRNSFLRRYFTFDLMMRNAKVEFLNKALGRPEGMDLVSPEGFEPDPDELQKAESALATDNLLGRERAMDELMWEMADEAVLFNLFDINVVLAFLSKLHIVQRWSRLDENTGREMFRRLVDEVRGTFRGVDYKE